MSGNRKYANLPDLDQAPEVYQSTADLDNAITVADSEASEESYTEDSEEEASGIQRNHVDPDSARSQFLSARVNADRANFSDQIGRSRRSYRVTNRNIEDDEDELDPEQRLKRHNLSRRIGRMQQLLEDLKADVETAKEKGEWKVTSQEDEDREDEAALIQLSESIKHMTVTDRGADSATTKMKRRAVMKRENAPSKLSAENIKPPAIQTGGSVQDYLQIADGEALAVYSKFSSRLDTLENLLGLDSIPPPDMPTTKDQPMPLLKMTDVMAKQLNLLSDIEDPYLDTLAKRIQTLTANAEQMEAKRKEAKKSYEELMNTREASLDKYGSSNGYAIAPRSPTLSGTTRRPGQTDERSNVELNPEDPLVDPELPGRIAALHSTLPAIENLVPLLHPTLERLRTLREVHQDASIADTRLIELEQHEAEIQKQMTTWMGMLGELEEQTTELEVEWLGNMQNVEQKVKELEDRIRGL